MVNVPLDTWSGGVVFRECLAFHSLSMRRFGIPLVCEI
jgi:hypothetical protein